MNKEKIQGVIDALKAGKIKSQPDLGFNMSNYFCRVCFYDEDKTGNGCGTVGCIAGWACAIDGAPVLAAEPHWNVENRAQEILELTWLERTDLFLGAKSGVYLNKITVKQAIETLERFRDTGEIRW